MANEQSKEELTRIRARCEELGYYAVRAMQEAYAFPNHWLLSVGQWLREQENAKGKVEVTETT